MDVPYQGRRNQGGENSPPPRFWLVSKQNLRLEKGLGFYYCQPSPSKFSDLSTALSFLF